jgi:general secretion pathway protein M
MAIPIIDRLGLNSRERRLLSILAVVFGVLVLLGIPVGLASLVHSRDTDNQELLAAINAVQAARAQVHDRQAKKDAIVTRYGRHAPPLAGLIQQIARQEKLEVTESQDRPEVPHGKRYVERTTSVHLKKAGMYAIAKFLEGLEKTGYPIDVSRLNIHKRTGEPDAYDVEVGVSAYDRSEAPAPASTSAPGSSGGPSKSTDDVKEKKP